MFVWGGGGGEEGENSEGERVRHERFAYRTCGTCLN